jgi:SPP1 gp7 family putative phage head morphogenesis protein
MMTMTQQARTNKYWEGRAARRMVDYQRGADSTIGLISQAYDKSIRDIEQEVRQIFNKFATDGKPSPDQARKLLNTPISRKDWDALKSQVTRIQDPAIRRQVLNQLNAPAYAARITRLEALKANNLIQARLIADAEIRLSTRGYIGTINEAYYRNMFDIQKGLGFRFDFAAVPTRVVEQILKNPWSGKSFSARVWGNTEVLADKLNETLTAGFMSGAGVKKMVQDIQELSQVGKHAATRLVRTEVTYMANAAEMESYEEAGIERYRFLATLDMRTSDICQEHDGKVFPVKDGVPGENMPPLHPYCRSTTIAYFGPEFMKNIQRRARDPVTGKNELVPGDMTYKEWRKGLDEKHGKNQVDIMEKKIRNKTADKKQHNRYRERLGNDVPKSFGNFQDLKYNRVADWEATKRQYATFGKIDSGPYSDTYRGKLRDTYRLFRKEGYEFTIHALNRTLGPKKGKGKVDFTTDDVIKLLGIKPNYLQTTDGGIVRFKDGLAIVQAPDTLEIKTIVSRLSLRSDWKEV